MRRRGKPLEVSTFPFLAVLLCAMGSLILVLIVMDRKAKMAARYKAQAAQTQAADDLAKADAARREKLRQQEAEAQTAWEHQRDDLHTTVLTQQQVVQAQMKQVQDQLNAAAARLQAQLDESSAAKQSVVTERARLAGEEKTLATLRQDVTNAAAQTAAERAAQAKMTADLAQLESTLKNLKEARERDKQTYSVVPYRGKHGENRRPLYVECTRNGVIFHPDRVEITLTNVQAARAEVERRVQRQNEYLTSIQAKTDDKPYLMLLVRPDGITSYYQIQSALHGMDLEFGYEFVDAGWLFDFSKEEERPAVAPAIVTKPGPTAPIPVGGSRGQLVAVAPPITVNPAGTHPDDGIGAGSSSSPFPGGTSGPGGSASVPGNGAGGPATGNAPTPFREGGSGPLVGPGSGLYPGNHAAGGARGSGDPSIIPPSAIQQGGSGPVVRPGSSLTPGIPAPGGANSVGGPSFTVPTEPTGTGGSGSGPALGGPGSGSASGSGGPSTDPPSMPVGAGGPVGSGSTTHTDGPAPATPGTTSQLLPPAAPVGPGGPGTAPPRADPPYQPTKPRTEFATDSDLHPASGNGSPSAPGQPGSPGTATGALPPAVSGPQLAPGVADSTRTGNAVPANPAGTSSGDRIARGGSTSPGGSTQQDGAPSDKDNGPHFAAPAAPPSPKKNQSPPTLRVALLNGDRDYLIFVECRSDDVVLYPSRQTFAVAPLTHGDQALAQMIKQMIERKQSLVRPGELPFRPQVRFLVRPDGIRSYHTTYPVLSTLNVPQTRQNLDADEDAIAVVTGR